VKETFAGDPTENDLRELSCEDQKSRVQVGEPSSTTPYLSSDWSMSETQPQPRMVNIIWPSSHS